MLCPFPFFCVKVSSTHFATHPFLLSIPLFFSGWSVLTPSHLHYQANEPVCRRNIRTILILYECILETVVICGSKLYYCLCSYLLSAAQGMSVSRYTGGLPAALPMCHWYYMFFQPRCATLYGMLCPWTVPGVLPLPFVYYYG